MPEVKLKNWMVLDRPGTELYHVELTVVAEHDDEVDEWVAEIVEFGVASQGQTVGEAIDAVFEAAAMHVNALEALGQRRQFFEERGIEAELGPLPERRRGRSAPQDASFVIHALMGASVGAGDEVPA